MALQKISVVDFYPQEGHRLFNFLLFRNLSANALLVRDWSGSKVIVVTYNTRRHFIPLLILCVFRRGVVLVNHNNVELAMRRPLDRILLRLLNSAGASFWNFHAGMSEMMQSWGFDDVHTRCLIYPQGSVSESGRSIYFHDLNEDLLTRVMEADWEVMIRRKFLPVDDFEEYLRRAKYVVIDYDEAYLRFSGMALKCVLNGCIMVLKENSYTKTIQTQHRNNVVFHDQFLRELG